ncbi:MAG: SURF1 family protein [Betaproteobacteria bacterium]
MPNALGTFLAHRRFRPTLWPTLALVVLVLLTVGLGNWQRHRAAEKEALRAQYELASRQPLASLDDSSDAAQLRYRNVRVAGVFDAAAQVYIDNKVHGGRVGYDVVTPLRLAGGRHVLVDRGWIAGTARRTELPPAPPPVGEVTVVGRINTPPARYLELRPDAATGPLRENLDIARIAASSGLQLLPFVIEQTQAGADGLVRDWAPPDFGIEQHRSYMVQWYSFAVLGCVLWVALNWRLRR